jgi:hypothetical protein
MHSIIDSEGRSSKAALNAKGQKVTYAPQKVMSALPLKADMCGALTQIEYPKRCLRQSLEI